MGMSLQQKEEILNIFRDMRCTDVRDGLDWIGYHHYGSMSCKMRPLWRTKAMGFAKTSRYIPYGKPVPNVKGHEYSEWSGWYYANVCIYPWAGEIEKYDFPVIDLSGLNVGLMGSMNTMEGLKRGGAGYVCNGGVRDTDEVILQKVPFWSIMIAQTMDQARIQYESHNTKINCDGVCVCPGDFVIADGDGVVVVPQDVILEVGKWATQEMTNDKKARRKLYDDLGLPLDDTVNI